MLTLSHFTGSLFASLLDSLALLAVKVGLLRGAHVSYTPGKPWHFDAWKAGESWQIDAAGFGAVSEL